MLQTIEVEIDASGRVHPVEPFEHLPSGRALLTLLQPTPASRKRLEAVIATTEHHAGEPLGTDNSSSVLTLLRSPWFQHAPAGDPATLEETIQANREAWNDR
jgi:hypothetical protein